MKLVVKFFDQDYETTIDCNSVSINREKEHPNTLMVKIVKSEQRTIVRCYPLSNVEYYEVGE